MTRGAVTTAITGLRPHTLITRPATSSAPGCVTLSWCTQSGPSGELAPGQYSHPDVTISFISGESDLILS